MLNPRASNDTGLIFGFYRLVGSEILTQFFIKPRRGIKRRPSLCQTVPGGKIHGEIHPLRIFGYIAQEIKVKILSPQAGGMAWQLRALIVLEGVGCSTPNTHMWRFTTEFPGRLVPSVGLQGHQAHLWAEHPCI